MKQENDEIIPIFFAVDNDYLPFLGICLQSIIDNISPNREYAIKILHTNVKEENIKQIMKFEKNNVDIEFVDLNYYINNVKDKLYTRDYYTKTTYFRLFIPNLYPQYKKAIYMDSDIVILNDIADLYDIEIGDNLIGGVTDGVILNIDTFKDYVEKVVGVSSWKNYFNAGVLLMNLDELRKYHFQEKFLYLLENIKFAVAQDQDYLNRLCKGRVKLIDSNWDVMPINEKNVKDKNQIKLIHYNLGDKPWHIEGIPFEEYFWKYAKKTRYYNEVLTMRNEYTEDQRFSDKEMMKNLIALAKKESDCVGDDRNKKNKIEKAEDRLEILRRIEILEREGKFDVDPEDDPPTIPLEPNSVDYLRKKSSSKIKTTVANTMAIQFFSSLVSDSKVIIKDVNGIENLKRIQKNTGGIVTCNHFNPFDSFTIEKIFRLTRSQRRQKLYKVIREGNYTNFPGFYGFLMRNCYTLPLSQNKSTMVEFMRAVDEILQKGDYILIFPEQSLWWNYRKPKPLKSGAFKIAAKNNVPVLPIFITMEDTDKVGEDGFPIQAYTVNIEEPIYPDPEKNIKENTEIMKEKNYEIWKRVYEDFYQIPLEYTTIDDGEKIEELV